MIYDYFLHKAKIKAFETWYKEKEASKRNKNKNRNRNRYWETKEKKLWLEDVFIKPLANEKKEIRDISKKDIDYKAFYPKLEDLEKLPMKFLFIKYSFILKKSYISKDDGEFHILNNGRVFENPIVRDKFTKLPMVKPSTWKGHLRFAAERVNWENQKEKIEIIQRLFGSDSSYEQLRGQVYFYPTFFDAEPKRDVLTPLSRKTRTPVKNKAPISIEIMKPGSKGEFYLLYILSQKGKEFRWEQVQKDIRFLARALKLMFYTYGFSAKKTSGFGIIEKFNEEEKEKNGKIGMKLDKKTEKEAFSNFDKLEDKLIEIVEKKKKSLNEEKS